ncbi:MAG: STAS domain-containing protein [Chitinivibrionales bacterium]|nr:STAS domain-containing protein [Chitinivibrionales bacterium]
MALTVKIKKYKDIPVLAASGRLINVDSERFLRKLENFCKKNYKKIIVDISEVQFIDSFGLGTLVQHHSKLQREGREFILVYSNTDTHTYIQRLFQMTGLNNVFTIVESLDLIST